MDTACFFIGEDVRRAMSIWKASGWRAEHAIQTLNDKCLVEVDACFDDFYTDNNAPRYVWRMHDHLRDLGRAMADNETSHPRRLWRPKDQIDIRQIEGFQDTLAGSEGKSFRSYSIMADKWSDLYAGYFMEISKTSTYEQWLSLSSFERGIKWIPKCIPLQNLHSLELYGLLPARLCQRDDQVLLKLKELSCSFEIGRTGSAHVNGDMLIYLVSSFGKFKNLESLHLAFDDSYTPDIEWNLLLKSVRELTNLKTLSLRGLNVKREITLSNRRETTDDRFCMRSLEALSLCYVHKTRKISISGQLCPTLKFLKLCSMTDLSEVDLTGVTTLECRVLFNCWELSKVLCNSMPELEMFRISRCWTMRELPNFGNVSCLKRIYISNCLELQDISAIERLKGLKRIWIAYCGELKSIKAIERLNGLKRIWIQGCRQLQGVICLKELKGLKRIFIGECDRLQDIQGIEYLNRLESIIITQCPQLQYTRGIEELEGLKEMIIAVDPIISCVKSLQRLPSELTILVGRGSFQCADKWKELMPDLNIDNCILPVECGIYGWKIEEKVKQMMDLFHKNQRSLSKLIICAMLDVKSSYPVIGVDICVGTRVKLSNMIFLSPGSPSFGYESTIYMCILNEGTLSKDYSAYWNQRCDIREAFVMGVEAGEERKTLRILQTIFAQQYVENIHYSEHPPVLPFKLYTSADGVDIDYDELAEYVDDDEKYDGGDDD